MKTLLAFLFSFFFLLSNTDAQPEVVLIGGISPGSNPTTADLIVNKITPQNEFLFNMNKISPQYTAGLKLHFPVANSFFHEIGMTYSKQTYHYTMEYTHRDQPEEPPHEMKETKNLLHIPASIGVSMGILDVTSGLNGIVSLTKVSDLDLMEGYKDEVNRFRMGYHAGLRVRLGPAAVGVEYNGEFNRVGQGMSVNGQSLELNNVPGRVMATVQYRF